jgi:hypothetical protein
MGGMGDGRRRALADRLQPQQKPGLGEAQQGRSGGREP